MTEQACVSTHGGPVKIADFGDKLVHIFVGVERKKYSVHKNLICKSGDFFRAVFQDNGEVAENKMDLPEDKPYIFDAFTRSSLATQEMFKEVDGATLQILKRKHLMRRKNDDPRHRVEKSEMDDVEGFEICAFHQHKSGGDCDPAPNSFGHSSD
ncbi:hypothetical protein BOTCAL_0002g00610 [Botryotinia calthae]|uniref:BTB domain-containing protein n=1 Tax=Botryotinia calthae TaxID=38488 RepID=A0A4Y8DKJ6_9HELO|nr:hypothetical protein BOTCAL_0002g00610 [Botryotinia calthae]